MVWNTIPSLHQFCNVVLWTVDIWFAIAPCALRFAFCGLRHHFARRKVPVSQFSLIFQRWYILIMDVIFCMSWGKNYWVKSFNEFCTLSQSIILCVSPSDDANRKTQNANRKTQNANRKPDVHCHWLYLLTRGIPGRHPE